MAMAKSPSTTSIGFGEQSPQNAPTTAVESSKSVESYGHYLYDSAAFVIQCQHKKMPIFKVEFGAGFWLPYVRLSPGQPYERSLQLISNLFAGFSTKDDEISESAVIKLDRVRALQQLRLQLPQEEYVTRIVYAAKWRADQSDCCQDTDRVKWLTACDVAKGVRDESIHEWGSELGEFARSAERGASGEHQLVEYTLNDALKFVKRENSTDKKLAKHSEMLVSARFGETEVIHVYSQFILHCYPSMNMSVVSFRAFVDKLKVQFIEKAVVTRVFKAFNCLHPNYLTFHEFLLGLAAMDPQSTNGEPRCPYIFRYYDSNSDGFMDRNDFDQLVRDINAGEKKSDAEAIKRDADERWRTPGLVENERISYQSFMKAIGSQRLRGTSALFRSNFSVVELLAKKCSQESISQHVVTVPYGYKKKGLCASCRPKNYFHAIHCIKLDLTGRVVEPMSVLQTDSKDLEFKREADSVEVSRKQSMTTLFNEASNPNVVLSVLRMFADMFRIGKKYAHFYADCLSAQSLTALCKEVRHVFVKEQRVLKINSPCFVFGAIRGNMADLLFYESVFWPTGPEANTASALFCGDYVDGGDYGVEVVAYLFALKILAPNKFFLLRGDHEVIEVQRRHTFEKECRTKYGRNGGALFEAINSVFDVLPIAGIVDESLFCCHGGIPASKSRVEDLMRIPCPLRNVETESALAWQILFNDPISDEDYKNAKQKDSNGFAANTKRSSAFYFTETAVNRFLDANGLSMIIRGHEPVTEGFRCHHSGRVVTVFSSSRYMKSANNSACVFIDGSLKKSVVRVIQMCVDSGDQK